jgi:hypothetical protein
VKIIPKDEVLSQWNSERAKVTKSEDDSPSRFESWTTGQKSLADAASIEDPAEQSDQAAEAIGLLLAGSETDAKSLARIRAMAKASKILSATTVNGLITEYVKAAAKSETEALPGWQIRMPNPGWTCVTEPRQGIERGVYFGGDIMAEIPFVHRRITRGAAQWYVMSATEDSRTVMISRNQIKSQDYLSLLDMQGSGDRRILDAMMTAILQIGHGPTVELLQWDGGPDARTVAGYIPIPPAEILPPGHFLIPGIPESERIAAYARLAVIISNEPKVALMYGASVGAPFLTTNVLNQPHFINSFDQPRRGKTIGMMAAATAWGNPRKVAQGGILRPMDTTALGIPRLMGDMINLPGFWDEIGTGGLEQGKLDQMILSVSAGATRTRSNREASGSTTTDGWTGGVAFTNGNRRLTNPTTTGGAGGVLVRVLEIEGPITSSAEIADELMAFILPKVYGFVGPEAMRTVKPDEFNEISLSSLAAVNGPAAGPLLTIRRNLANAVTGAIIADRIISGITGRESNIADAALRAANQHMEGLSEPITDSQRLLDLLDESLQSDSGRWARRSLSGDARELPLTNAKIHGAYDDEWIYIFPSAYAEFVTQGSVDSAVANSQLFEAGILDVSKSLRRQGKWITRSPLWVGNGKQVSVYKISRKRTETSDDESEATESKVEIPAPVDYQGEIMGLTDVQRRAEFVVAMEARGVIHSRFTKTKALQREYMTRALAVIDGPIDPDSTPGALQILEALEGANDEQSGPYTTWGTVDGKPMPPLRNPHDYPTHVIADCVKVTGYGNRPRIIDGQECVILDRNAAWPSSSSSARLPFGELTHTGEVDLPESGEIRPGFYLMVAYPWTEQMMPNPFPGDAVPGKSYWLPSPVAELLRGLAKQDRWPDMAALDSWTGEAMRLQQWARYIAALREYALRNYGRKSPQFETVKDGASMALSRLKGKAGATMKREYACRTRRPDIPILIEAQSAVTMWRRADAIDGPVGIQNKDELVILASDYDRIVAEKLVKIDQDGYKLGTFKVQSRETWKVDRKA